MRGKFSDLARFFFGANFQREPHKMCDSKNKYVEQKLAISLAIASTGIVRVKADGKEARDKLRLFAKSISNGRAVCVSEVYSTYPLELWGPSALVRHNMCGRCTPMDMLHWDCCADCGDTCSHCEDRGGWIRGPLKRTIEIDAKDDEDDSVIIQGKNCLVVAASPEVMRKHTLQRRVIQRQWDKHKCKCTATFRNQRLHYDSCNRTRRCKMCNHRLTIEWAHSPKNPACVNGCVFEYAAEVSRTYVSADTRDNYSYSFNGTSLIEKAHPMKQEIRCVDKDESYEKSGRNEQKFYSETISDVKPRQYKTFPGRMTIDLMMTLPRPPHLQYYKKSASESSTQEPLSTAASGMECVSTRIKEVE